MEYTLNKLIENLVQLQKDGHGEKQVVGICGSSGAPYRVCGGTVEQLNKPDSYCVSEVVGLNTEFIEIYLDTSL
jgi:hypothetical protein